MTVEEAEGAAYIKDAESAAHAKYVEGAASGLAFLKCCRRVEGVINQAHRYRHSVGVARTAHQLAMRHGVDPKRARIAGLFHDLARLWAGPRLIAECERRGIAVSDFERRVPVVLHAPIGAILAREQFGVDDSGILQAIEKHTLAAPDMTKLDAIVFISDAVEPGRDFPDRAKLFALASRDLQAGLHAVYLSSIDYLTERGLEVGPGLAEAIGRPIVDL